MKFEDITTLTQEAVSQTLGTKYMQTEDGNIKPIESFKLADVGKDVLDSGTVDAYVKSLLVQMGKMVVDAKVYKAEMPSIFVDNFEWGGYVERVYYSPQDLIEDEMYNLVDGNSYDDHVFYKPKTSAKIFEEAKTIMCPISITRDQMEMAFQSWEQMNTFLSGIYNNVQNTIILGMEAYSHMLISCGIAVSAKATNTAVHLLTEYNAINTDATIATAAEALRTPEFLLYALERIATIKDYSSRYTTAFNNKSIPTFTNDEDKRLALLSDFARAVKFNLKANTFHDEMIGIGDFDTITSWQAFRDASSAFSFDVNSQIQITADSNNKLGIGTDAVTLNNVIGVFYDHRSMGLCPHRSKVTSNYTAIADFWNEFHHELVNYILDSNYNIVAFIID